LTVPVSGPDRRPVEPPPPITLAHTGRAAAARPPARAGGGYSRFVGLMRIALPLVAGAIIALVIAWPELGEKRSSFKLGMSKITVNDSSGQTVVNPRFTGTDRSRRPYTVTADAATQDQKAPNQIDLAFPKADLTLEDGAWIAISAANGRYDRKGQMLTLSGGVDLFHDRGFELHTPSARVSLADGGATGEEPVRGQGPFGTIEGQGFRMVDKGRLLMLSGKSRLVLFSGANGGKP